MAAGLAILGGLGLGGCNIADVEIEGKRCPCPEPEYVCDTATNTCITGQGCTPRFTVKDFTAAWTTTQNIRWQWEPLGAEDDFGSYVIEVSQRPEDIEAGTPDYRLDGDSHAELGVYRLHNTGELEVVRASVTYALEDDTTWHARLIATDRFGCEFASPIVTAKTLAEPLLNARVFFDDTLHDGSLYWSQRVGTFAINPSCDGNPCLEAISTQNATQNLRIIGMTQHTGAAFANMSETQFETQAMLEFRVWIEEPDPAFWFGIFIEAVNHTIYRYEPYTPIRTPSDPVQASYWTVQLPLRELRHDETAEPLTHAQFIDADGGGISQFNFGTVVPVGKRAWLDDIRVRW